MKERQYEYLIGVLNINRLGVMNILIGVVNISFVFKF